MRTPRRPSALSQPSGFRAADNLFGVLDRTFTNITLGVPVPLEKERLVPMDWTWHGNNPDIVHAMFKRESTPYTITKVDYVTGCRLALSVDMIPPRARLKGRVVTCLQCAVAGINTSVIPGE